MAYNPYLQQDLTSIIDAFTKPGAGLEVQEAIGTGLPAAVYGSPDTKYSYAWASERLQDKMDKAKSWVKSIKDYRKAGPTGNIAGVEFKNTFGSILSADDAGEAMLRALADCVPCEDRILALLSLNPLEELANAANRMYQMQVAFLLDLFDLLLGDKSLGVFADFCSLIDFLNFECIPDVVRMILVLGALVQKYSVKLSSLQLTVTDILGRMFGASLAPLLSMIDKYIQLIVAPIECVINEIDFQMQKLDVEYANKVVNKERAKKTMKLDKEKLAETVKSPLLTLRFYLTEATDAVEEEYEKLNKQWKDLLGIEEGTDKEMMDITNHIEQATRLIALLQAIILTIQQGSFMCGPEKPTENEFATFVNTILAPNTELDIVAQDGVVKVSPPYPTNVKSLLEALGTMQAGKKDLPKVASVSIPIKSCLYRSTDRELEKVKEYLSTF
jgi:hypothetical protein